MKQIVLSISDKRFDFFMELIKSFRFIKVKEVFETEIEPEPTREEILANIRQGLKEVQLIEQGKMKSTPLKDFLNEL